MPLQHTGSVATGQQHQESTAAPCHPRDAFREESRGVRCPPWEGRGSGRGSHPLSPSLETPLSPTDRECCGAPRTTSPLCAVGVPAGTTGAPNSAREKTAPARVLTAKLLEVGLQLLAGAEEDPSLLGAHHEGTLLVDGDAGHLCVQLGERRALRGGTGSERLREHPCLALPARFQ